MITEKDKHMYAKCMEIIKIRLNAIDDFLVRGKTTLYPITNSEFLYLQFRFIFELICLSSLCAHRDEFEKFNQAFRKEWNANRILKRIRKINPYFYPRPHNTVAPKGGEPGSFVPILEGYLTEEELSEALGLCGNNLHQYNPYKIPQWPSLEAEKKRFMEWRSKVVTLLNTHCINLFGERVLLRVVMNTVPDGEVSVQEWHSKGPYKGKP